MAGNGSNSGSSNGSVPSLTPKQKKVLVALRQHPKLLEFARKKCETPDGTITSWSDFKTQQPLIALAVEGRGLKDDLFAKEYSFADLTPSDERISGLEPTLFTSPQVGAGESTDSAASQPPPASESPAPSSVAKPPEEAREEVLPLKKVTKQPTYQNLAELNSDLLAAIEEAKDVPDEGVDSATLKYKLEIAETPLISGKELIDRLGEKKVRELHASAQNKRRLIKNDQPSEEITEEEKFVLLYQRLEELVERIKEMNLDDALTSKPTRRPLVIVPKQTEETVSGSRFWRFILGSLRFAKHTMTLSVAAVGALSIAMHLNDGFELMASGINKILDLIDQPHITALQVMKGWYYTAGGVLTLAGLRWLFQVWKERRYIESIRKVEDEEKEKYDYVKAELVKIAEKTSNPTKQLELLRRALEEREKHEDHIDEKLFDYFDQLSRKVENRITGAAAVMHEAGLEERTIAKSSLPSTFAALRVLRRRITQLTGQKKKDGTLVWEEFEVRRTALAVLCDQSDQRSVVFTRKLHELFARKKGKLVHPELRNGLSEYPINSIEPEDFLSTLEADYNYLVEHGHIEAYETQKQKRR